MTPTGTPRPPSLMKNPVTFAGLALALVVTAIGLPMMFIDMLSPYGSPYFGIIIYGVLPATAGLGVALAAFGAWRERRRRLRRPGAPPPVLPRIDLNVPRQRWWLAGSLAVFLVVGLLLSVTGYRAYHFSDSVQFCGVTCHSVMKPEYTAYRFSPHARVACVECHVGPGASWFVRSKLSGAYQIYATLANKYPRPIPTPIEDLRPAQHTCEQCHWPAKFFGAQQKTFRHYQADEKNTPWEIQTLLKIGGGDPGTGATTGIHWHMNIKNEIYYVATDEKRLVIPWVKSVDRQGRATVYMSEENPLPPEELAKARVRRMDCMDCHNRPSHVFHSPATVIDRAFDAGTLEVSLPYLKREGVRLLSERYPTEAAAHRAILQGITEFYRRNYPALAERRAPAISQAVETLQRLFSVNIFPEMRADWRVYPNHISHYNWDGCFRCHDGLHKSRDGKLITRDCNACHTIMAQGSPKDVLRASLRAQPFRHPVDVGVDVTEMKCTACHGITE